MLLIFLGIVTVMCSSVTTTEVKECKGLPFPTSVEITNCVTPPCILKRGTNMTWSTVFTANENHEQFIISLVATMMGVKHGYPGIDNTIGCDSLYSLPDNTKVGCPVQKGKTYRHDLFMDLKLPMPKVTVPARFAFKDKTSKEEFVCFELTVSTKP